MTESPAARMPNIIGGEAAAITQQGNPYVFRSSFTQSAAMPKVVRYMKDSVKAKSVAIVYVNNDFGKGGRDAITKTLEAAGHQGRCRYLDRSRVEVGFLRGLC